MQWRSPLKEASIPREGAATSHANNRVGVVKRHVDRRKVFIFPRMNVKLQFTKGNSDGSKGRNDRGKQSAENAHYQTEQNSHEK